MRTALFESMTSQGEDGGSDSWSSCLSTAEAKEAATLPRWRSLRQRKPKIRRRVQEARSLLYHGSKNTRKFLCRTYSRGSRDPLEHLHWVSEMEDREESESKPRGPSEDELESEGVGTELSRG